MAVAADLPARPLRLDDVTRLAEADTRHRFEVSAGNSSSSRREHGAIRDRWLKPVEYAEAGIALFGRVEPDDTVVQFRPDGNRYVEYGSITLDSLLAGGVPDLSL